MRLIDKDALMKALNIAYDCTDCEYKNGMFCNKSSDFVNACEAICDAPTIEPEQQKGKWIESALVPSRRGKPDGRLFICSACNKGWVKQDRSMRGINFCPNCGTDMRGEEDGNQS